ncbi:PAS domain S-box protein [Phenylobacterium terrae]|uniref:PAS domain S-box protein n=1 Tax=Phenylobacterium terrae TaxID=2665495 RepID=A0ABW4N394_9CAUL
MDGSGSSEVSVGRMYGAYWRDAQECLFTVRVTSEGGFVFDSVNPADERRTGLKNLEIAGRTPHEVLPQDRADEVTARYRTCVALGHPISYEETLDLPAGRRRFETSLAPLRDDNGVVHLLLGSARDVTERHEAQAALAESEARLRAITDMVPDILFSAPPYSGPDYLNSRFFEYSGLPESTSPAECLATVHPDDLGRFKALVRDAGGELLQAEVRVRARDGGYRWFLVRAEMVQTLGGRRWFGVATDIQAVKQAAEEVSALNARLTQVLSSISDGYYTVDNDWRMTGVNTAALAWMNRRAEQLVGVDVRTWIRPRQELARAIELALNERVASHVECSSAFRPGRWIELHVYPSDGGASVFFRDITERRETQARVEEARGLLQGSLDAMPAEIALLDQSGRIVEVNTAWRRMIADRGGRWPADGVGQRYVDVCREAMIEFDEAAVSRALQNLATGKDDTFLLSMPPTVAGGMRWRQLRMHRFVRGADVYLVAAREDLTEICEAQAALREATRRLLSAQEDERQRIAVELHDSTSQHLVALSLGVARLRRSFVSARGFDLVLEDMEGSVDEALKEVRLLSYLLNPPNLNRDGLGPAIRAFVEGVGRRSGLHTVVRLEGRLDDLAADVQRTIYRVVQESLSNVHRHAKAQGVQIELSRRAFMLSLSVADDGCGIGRLDLGANGDVRLGVGIPGMKARVEQLGGALTIVGDSAGTRLEARIPLRPAWPERAPRRVPLARRGSGAGVRPMIGPQPPLEKA